MENKIIRITKIEKLKIIISEDRKTMGILAAENVAERINELLKTKDEIRMIFGAAPSQDEFFESLIQRKDINWSRIVAFHMDEYLNLPGDAPQLFSKYLNEHIFSKVNFREVNIINSMADDMEKECSRYSKILSEEPIDIVCLGIGENGHIAFNDPPVADFNDTELVKIVELDKQCRQQQVNDGCFSSFEEVPKYAVTLTVPCLMSASHLSIVVPGKRKAEAVKNALTLSVSKKCPASILKTHNDAVLFLDGDSSALLG